MRGNVPVQFLGEGVTATSPPYPTGRSNQVAGKSFGSTRRFSIEVGDVWGDTDTSRRVDVVAADRWLTCEDNHAYGPHSAGRFARAVASLMSDPRAPNIGRPYPELSPADNHRRLLAGMRSEDDRDYREHAAYRFMDWGPIADNVHIHLFREDGIAFLPFSFFREDHHDPSELGQVFVAQLPEWELACVLHDAAWAIMWDWADRSKWPK